MIPKIIHYCWFGKGPIPAYLQSCIDTWKRVLPDYEIKCWNEDNYDVTCCQYVKEAYDCKKYAFVSDYARIDVLHKYGGIYMDTDVEVKHSFDRFLSHNFVSGVEYHDDIFKKNHSSQCLDNEYKRLNPNNIDVVGFGILAAVIMSTKGCPLLKGILDYYQHVHFLNEDGSYNLIVSPAIYAAVAENFGFRYKNVDQNFGDDYCVFSDKVFAVKETMTEDSVAVHIGNGSWIDDDTVVKKITRNLKKYKFTTCIYRFLRKIIKGR